MTLPHGLYLFTPLSILCDTTVDIAVPRHPSTGMTQLVPRHPQRTPRTHPQTLSTRLTHPSSHS